jgi:transketolase
MRNEFFERFYEIFKTERDSVLITADLGYGLLNRFFASFPNRVFNLGITEQSIVSIAAGIALSSRRVYVYSISNFITLRVLEQIRNDIISHDINVVIINGGGGYSYGNLGFTHHSTEDLSIMRVMPNLSIYSPSSGVELDNTLEQFRHTFGPIYLRLFKSTVSDLSIIGSVNNLGGYATYFDGKKVLILVSGGVLSVVLDIINNITNNPSIFKVINIFRIKPLNYDSISHIIRQYNEIITIEDNSLAGGFGSLILENLNDNNEQRLIKRFGINDVVEKYAGTQEYLIRKNILLGNGFEDYLRKIIINLNNK